MLRKIVIVSLFCVVFPSLLLAAPQLRAGKEFKILPEVKNGLKAPGKGKVLVTEFFSYGCPACHHFEPALEKWLAHKPKNVVFERIPVVFHEPWLPLAKAYYTAKKLGVARRMSPAIFHAIFNENNSLGTEASLAKLFAKHGVKKADFKRVYNFAPEMIQQLKYGQYLMNQYKVYAVPTVIVNGKYRSDVQMAGGSAEKLIQVMNGLIKAESQQ